MYLAIRNFVDLEDGLHRYVKGDKYPRQGYKPSKERIKALMDGSNKSGYKLIREVKAKKKGCKKAL